MLDVPAKQQTEVHVRIEPAAQPVREGVAHKADHRVELIGIDQVVGVKLLLVVLQLVPHPQVQSLDLPRCARFDQVALMADSLSKIALRSGVFCAEPGMGALGAPREGAVRASLYLYNTEEEVRIFAEAMAKIAKIG